jgi:hypothetical protein
MRLQGQAALHRRTCASRRSPRRWHGLGLLRRSLLALATGKCTRCHTKGFPGNPILAMAPRAPVIAVYRPRWVGMHHLAPRSAQLFESAQNTSEHKIPLLSRLDARKKSPVTPVPSQNISTPYSTSPISRIWRCSKRTVAAPRQSACTGDRTAKPSRPQQGAVPARRRRGVHICSWDRLRCCPRVSSTAAPSGQTSPISLPVSRCAIYTSPST